MAVDLGDLIESLRRNLSPPGDDLFPDAEDDTLVGQLSDAFWEARLFGFFDDFSEADGLITPIAAGGDDLARDWQQLIVLFAAIRAIRLRLMNTNTNFRAKAGPVEFETSNSANLLNNVLKQLQDEIDRIFAQLGELGASATFYINGLCARTESLMYGGESWWG